MHEVLYAAVPAAAGAWYGTRSWLARRRLLRRPPGEPVADFTLPGADGRRHSLSGVRSPIVVLLFMSNRCPGVKAYDGRLRALAARHPDAAFVGINPIDERLYPGEGLAGMRRALADRRLDLLYLKDRDQAVARRLEAVCTPEAVVLDAQRRIRYRGRIDDSLVERGVRKRFLEDAIVALRRGREPPVARTAPLGCSIDPVRGNAIVAGILGS